MTTKPEAPERIVICVDGHKPMIADWAKEDMHNCDFEYVRADHAPNSLKLGESKAREIVKHIADAAIELAFVRHDLTSDEYDEPDDTDVEGRAAAFQAFVDELKDDTLNCLTGDETGCLDPEDLNASNCELIWLREVLGPITPQNSDVEQQLVL